MIVSIAKLGSDIQDVTLETNATVMTALKSAGYSLDSVVSVKRNGSEVTMDTVLSDGDVLMVSQEKVKGGNDEDVEKQSVIRIGFEIKKQSPIVNKGKQAFLSTQSTFEIIKSALNKRGSSMNNFVKVLDEEENEVSFSDKFIDGHTYTIIVSDNSGRDEEDDEDDY